jgi:hypothetical protein
MKGSCHIARQCYMNERLSWMAINWTLHEATGPPLDYWQFSRDRLKLLLTIKS